MKPRYLIALILVLAVMIGTGVIASATEGEPNCWYVSYTVTMRGKRIVKVPNSCIPCLGVCDLLPPPPGATNRQAGPVAVQ